jgi:hypothetical protein
MKLTTLWDLRLPAKRLSPAALKRLKQALPGRVD